MVQETLRAGKQKGKPGKDNNVTVGWADGDFTIEKDDAVMADGPNATAASVFQWSIANETGAGGNAMAIDVTIVVTPPISNSTLAGGNNIGDGHSKNLTLTVPANNDSNGVFDYYFVVTQHGGTATKTFTVDDPWLVVY